MKLLITCPFWLTAILNKELKLLGYKPFDTFDTWTYIEWDKQSIYKININSRIANKVFIALKQALVFTFDVLFHLLADNNRSNYIKKGSHISIKSHINNSKLNSQKTIISIQWMYNHGLFRLLYALITITVTVLIFITLSEIPLQLQFT